MNPTLARIALRLYLLHQLFDRFCLLFDAQRENIDVHLMQLIAKITRDSDELRRVFCGLLTPSLIGRRLIRVALVALGNDCGMLDPEVPGLGANRILGDSERQGEK